MKTYLWIIIVVLPLTGCSSGYWLTPDQRGDRLMSSEKYEEAATSYVDPFRKGVALYRAGSFEAAAASFGRLNTPEACFNRGNALVMMGKYTDALAAYDQALALKSDWKAASENRDIARIRAERKDFEGGDMTGGMIGSDGFVFDKGGKNTSGDDEDPSSDSGPPLSDDQLKALWLRRVQTKPADFLKAKFAYQFSQQDTRGQ